MKWHHPPIIKTYEALGAVADGRVEIDGNKARVLSSSRDKYYDVAYDLEKRAIMANDNGSYWKGYLGYPSIAFLLGAGVLAYYPKAGELLKGIAWKDINQRFKNDFDKTLEHIMSSKTEAERSFLAGTVKVIDEEIKKLDIGLLGKKTMPPEGY